MNIPRKIMLYAIIAAISVIVFNRVDGVLKATYFSEYNYQNVEELDAAYEQEQNDCCPPQITKMYRWIELDDEFGQVMLILGIGIITSIMLRLCE